MAKLKETTQEKKARRNKAILGRYNELKIITTCRKAIEMLEDEYNLSKSTIEKILFIKSYSSSPLSEIQQNAEDSKHVPNPTI